MLIAGRYRLLEPVGSGGMGRVWLARDEMLDRDVAVKEFVPPDWMTDDEKSRLKDRTLREARSAGRLNHPHVVRVYDVVHAEGLPWIVMEYVPSRSLHQVINQDGPYSPVAAARIGLSVLDALSAAHRAGVLHRDVKPHNVLIGTDGRVVLTDFGLATFVDDGSITGPGLVVGSPQYVSPERARDGASTVESDMWSLGATLYAAVEGRSPYARDTAMATLMALATEPPDPPERAGPLAPVLLGLLRQDPDSRLTASEVERSLRMVVAAALGGVWVPAPRKSRAVAASTPAPAAAPAAGAPSAGEPAKDGRPVVRPVPGPRAPADPPPVPPPRRPRSALVTAGLVVVAVLGGSILAGYLIQRDSPPATSGAGPGRSATLVSFSPATCTGPAPSAAPRLPQPGAARGVNGWTLIRGWSYFTDGSGLHMPVPDGWTYQRIGTMYCFRDPTGDRVLSLDTGRNPAGDPVRACRTEAARLVQEGALPGYEEVVIEERPLLDKAADWEYRYQDTDGTELHARTRWFARNGRGYAISWSAREIDWTGDLSKINMVLSTFYADRMNP
jgi:tRNA A-37 threonylcarbamoyl transferase component Bud32